MIAVEGVKDPATLADAVAATGPFDIVDVFRRPEQTPEHAREAVAAGARCLWLQLGVVSWVAAAIAHEIRNPLTGISGALSAHEQDAASAAVNAKLPWISDLFRKIAGNPDYD